MDPRDIYPTCVLKVNLGCCQACVVGLKKLLSTIDGVYGYEIDLGKGLVTVLGKAHPQLLVEKIRQKKKKAEVVSYEKPTPNAKAKDSNNTKEYKKNGKLDSKPKENKKKHGNGDQKGFKEGKIICNHESYKHEFEDYVPPKPHPLETCRDPYCNLHHKKPVIINASDNMSKVMFQPPLNRPRFLPPPPRFLPPPPGPHYPRSYREEYPEDHPYRVPHVEPIVYDRSIYESWNHQRPLPQYDSWNHHQRPLPQYDSWNHQRPLPQYGSWNHQRPAPPILPSYGYHGIMHTYPGRH